MVSEGVPYKCDDFTHLLERIYYADTPRLKFYLTSQILKLSDRISDESIAIKTIKAVDIDFISLLLQSNGLFTLLGLQLIQLLLVSKHCANVLDSIRPLIITILSELINDNNKNLDEDIKCDLIINGIECTALFFRLLPYHRFCEIDIHYEPKDELIKILFPNSYDNLVNTVEETSPSNDLCPYCQGTKSISNEYNDLDNLLDKRDEYYDMETKWQMETFSNVIRGRNTDGQIISTISSIAQSLIDQFEAKYLTAIMHCSVLLSIGNLNLSKKCLEILLKNDTSLGIKALNIINSKKQSKKCIISNYKEILNAILATKLDKDDIYNFFCILSEHKDFTSVDQVQLLAKRAYIEVYVIVDKIMRSGDVDNFNIFSLSCSIIENAMLYLDTLEEDHHQLDESPLDTQERLIEGMSNIACNANMGKISQLFKIFHDTVLLFFDYFNYLDENYTKVVSIKKDVISCGVRLVGCWMYLEPTHLRVQFKSAINPICKFCNCDDFLWLLPSFSYFEPHELCDFPLLLTKLIEAFYRISTSNNANMEENKLQKGLKNLCIILNRVYLDTLVEPTSLLIDVDSIVDQDTLDDYENKCYAPIKLAELYYQNPLEYIPIPYDHVEGYIDKYRKLTKLMIISALSNQTIHVELVSSACIAVIMSRGDGEISEELKFYLYKRICKGLLLDDDDVFETCLNTSILMSTRCIKFKSILDTTLYTGCIINMDEKLISYQRHIIQ